MKMQQYGIEEIVLNWIWAFHSIIHQILIVNGSKSKRKISQVESFRGVSWDLFSFSFIKTIYLEL